jgi:hypothetical protein
MFPLYSPQIGYFHEHQVVFLVMLATWEALLI